MSHLLYDGFHKIERVESTIKGKTVVRERLHLKSAVSGLVIDTNNRIALVTQYRPTINQTTKEIPAGVMDKGLTPVETLLEELEEECELFAEDILEVGDTPIREYYMVAGSSDATSSIYLVRVSEQQEVNKSVPKDNDVESIEWVTLGQLERYIENGSVVDAKTLIAYEYAKELLR